MFTSDQQILKLPKILKKLGRISSISQFHQETGVSKQIFSMVKNQDKISQGRHFTPKQIEVIIKLYSVNGNWIFGVSEEVFEGIVEHYIEY